MYEFKEGHRWALAGWTTLMFLIVSSPWTYFATDRIFSMVGLVTTGESGPTAVGMALHVVVFFLLVRLILELDLYISSESKDDDDDTEDASKRN